MQPTLEAGYDLLRTTSVFRVVPAISFGYEFNVKTVGEEVGEGAILLGKFYFATDFERIFMVRKNFFA